MEISKERKRTSHFPFEAATGRVLNVYSHEAATGRVLNVYSHEAATGRVLNVYSHEAVFSFCLFQSRSH